MTSVRTDPSKVTSTVMIGTDGRNPSNKSDFPLKDGALATVTWLP
jgi:hypothetical protein